MPTVLRWREGVTGPSAPITLQSADPAATLAGATVTLTLETFDGASVLVEDAAVQVVDAAAMTVRYDVPAAVVAEHRRLRGRFLATYSDGSQEPFPTAGYLLVVVEPDVGASA